MRFIFAIAVLIFIQSPVLAQEEMAPAPVEDSLEAPNVSDSSSVAEQIKNERDSQLKALNSRLDSNKIKIDEITQKLDAAKNLMEGKVKVEDMQKLQIAFDERLRILEEKPKTRISLNGQLAFIELLSIQRDIRPANLFLHAQQFFNQLGDVSKIQNYERFKTWKGHYDQWYKKQEKKDQLNQLLNNSLTLITDISNEVPLYGAFAQSVSSGLRAILPDLGRKHRALKESTPAMLELLNVTSQFEHQKSIIDHEWAQINEELRQIKEENEALLEAQFSYYGIEPSDYQRLYLQPTLEQVRDNFKKDCRRSIIKKISSLESNAATKGKWMAQVEIFMNKVQSLRLRFGTLTARIKSNINRYQELIDIYSRPEFPEEFTRKIKRLEAALEDVDSSFENTFSPQRYIEDSAVMYIER